jgi:ribosomal protein S18 acetylase RimI-like enzyme
MTEFRLVPFDPDRSYRGMKRFECGNGMIDAFVRKSLKKRVKRNYSRAYLLLDEKENVVAFYTLDAFSIVRELFEISERPAGLPPSVPVIKLGMLGVDKSYQGRGIGRRLLRHAMVTTLEISERVGSAGLFLWAESDAVAFYERLGFVSLKMGKPRPMFLSIETIREAMRDS